MPSPQFPQVAMETEEPIIGSYVFHGIEYIVSLSSREDQLIVEVEEKDSADQWRETYDAPCESSLVAYYADKFLSQISKN